MTTRKPMTIGDVVELLKKEFPSVTVSKLRFLESEGLIHPPRSDSGYREFREEDVERVRYILRQQRDHFLPLKVIRTNLRAWERGEEPTPAPQAGPPPDAYFGKTGTTMGPEDLARAAAVPRAVVDELVDHGLLRPRRSDDGAVFSEEDAAIARAAYRMIGHGLEARHLRAIRLGANREVDLFRQLATPLLRHASPASRRQAAEILADVAQAAREMQEAMVKADLREMLDR